MKTEITRQQALNLLIKYNQEPFHLLHGLTVEGVMRWYARGTWLRSRRRFLGIGRTSP